jgi:hypothetical protein
MSYETLHYCITCPLCDRVDKCEDFIQCTNCYENICESCYPESNINICQLCSDIDSITENLSDTNIFGTDEYDELKNNVYLQIIDINVEVLNKTKKRYERYINTIKVWEINDICCLHIKDAILLFLKNYYDKTSANLMKTIDLEIFNLINSV